MSESAGRIGPDNDGSGEPHTSRWSDDEAIVRLWRLHRRWLAAVLLSHKPRDVDVEDLLQEVAMKLVRNIHKLDDPNMIRPWLRTVAVNAARSAGRKSRTRSKVESPAEFKPEAVAADDGNGLEVPLHGSAESSQQRGRRAIELVHGLPPHYREPLFLSLRGLSQKQIAEAMDVPVTTVETRLIRARRMVREGLEAEEAASEKHMGENNAEPDLDYIASPGSTWN